MGRLVRPLAALLLAQLLLFPGVPAALGAGGCPRTSEVAMESRFMCQVCGVPLPLANSLEADRERAFISQLVSRCESPAQIQAAMVAQYGRDILATPPSGGFGIAAWLVPVAALLLALVAIGAVIAVARGRARSRRYRAGPVPVSAEDAELLDAALAAFESGD
jgi:cytochrome c-type biogenesis protein CcmH/NrfF